jgi:LPS-assembly protein
MRPNPTASARSLIAILALSLSLLLVTPSAARTQDEGDETDPESTEANRTETAIPVEVQFKKGRREGDTQILEGSVTLVAAQGRFQADYMEYRDKRFIEASGNVLIVWGNNRISGTRMSYDLQEDVGSIENAIGHVEPEFFFYADKVEKVGDDLLYLENANVTTCTQPVPYWSFAVSRAKVRIDGYAQLWNLRLRVKDKPVFYLPYLLWPVKKDRSVGLLFPSFGSTETRGTVIAQGLFIPIGRTADLTLVGEYYTEAGFGLGGEARFVPNRKGLGVFNGFYINDKAANTTVCAQPPCDRWRVTYRQTQEFQNGFRMVADINQVSDFDFFTDFERDLRLVSTPTQLTRIEFSRNGKWTSVNVRELRREQLLAPIVQVDPDTGEEEVILPDPLLQQTLPEIEFRGRNRQIGNTPLYVSYLSSFTSIRQSGDTIDADYLRADLFPTLTVPISTLPWLDASVSLSYRLTHYTQRNATPGAIETSAVDDPLTRGLFGAALETVGPRIQRIFGERGSTQYKHVWEPLVRFGFRQEFLEEDEVIRFDEVDIIPGQNVLTYGIRTRLFAKRPRAKSRQRFVKDEVVVMPDGESFAPEALADFPVETAPEPPPPDNPAEPVEILTVDLIQSRDFDGVISSDEVDGVPKTSPRGPILLTGRYNPTQQLSIDLRSRYSILQDAFDSVAVSGTVRQRAFRIGFSWTYTPSFTPGTPSSSQARFNTGFQAFGGRLRMEFDGAYTAIPVQVRNLSTGEVIRSTHLPDRRVRLEWYTQCCGLLAEYLARDYTGAQRRDFRFTVDLRGIGKFLDVHHGLDR